ncbi:S-adenosyl-L-methionine-dependent methyltransferase [Tricharina praecox]|uniref:S-adenosyl-L-methionine-dependent methyltransferase n=1 Tax=Tricharina praecox TaxID=43433 RepID=UPI00221F770E|nr:S-adenosyl-L-methionine-dependent methyltransferase [Tricharina praecox]KAI5844349.1 S-adenosyl-L-methionine-dependent methyltransferase [Tricharina praecox]
MASLQPDAYSDPADSHNHSESIAFEDSLYSSGSESSTASLSSSVLDYVYENGRRYHAFRAGQYALPNDETEQDRLDMMHHIYSMMLRGRLHLAPIPKDASRILDIGTGTGIWAIDMGDSFPAAQVIGVDLSPIQPSWVPPNVQFVVDDVECDWMFSDDSFEFIHIRSMLGSIKDWPRLLSQCYRCLKPGGFIEIVEAAAGKLQADDDTYTPQSAIWRYYELVNQAAAKAGRSLQLMNPSIRDLVTTANFGSYKETEMKLPLGTWPSDRKLKEMGAWFALSTQSGFSAYGLALLTRVLNMPSEEVYALFGQCNVEVNSKKVHAYGNM